VFTGQFASAAAGSNTSGSILWATKWASRPAACSARVIWRWPAASTNA